jgi:sedoheptulokinase
MKTIGIDLGTTKVAIVVVNETGIVLEVVSRMHHSKLETTVPGAAEQDAEKIFACVRDMLQELPQHIHQEIGAVGITGQMHSLLIRGREKLSPLITWQDRRCGKELITEFNRVSGLSLHEGFGGLTLARLAAEGRLDDDMQAATISDMLVAELTGNNAILTDPTHAASWGIYDCDRKDWAFDALAQLSIPNAILPSIRASGSVAGQISTKASAKYGLVAGIPVLNAIGDNQASILGTGYDARQELYLTLGTGAQLSAVVDSMPENIPEELEIRPFPGGRFLLVSAALCGGSAFAWLGDTINNFRRDLGDAELPRNELLDRLDELALKELKTEKTELTLLPHFLGERHDSTLHGTVCGLTLNNATPGKLAAALALGIVRNLMRPFPVDLLSTRKIVIGSGNAVRLLKSIQFAIEQEFGLPLRIAQMPEEAAFGAARQAMEVCLTNAETAHCSTFGN